MSQHLEKEIHSEKECSLQKDRTVPLLFHVPEKQRDSSALLETLVENSFDLLGLLDETGKYLYVEESTHNAAKGTQDSLLGYQASDFIGRDSFEFFHPDDLPRLKGYFSLLFNGCKKIHVPPYRFLDGSGNWRWMEAIITNQLSHPQIRAIIVSCRDVSHQIATENKLKEMQQVAALMEGEEKERSRIAKDLHDGVAGMLAAVKMHFNSVSIQHQCVLQANAYQQGIRLLDEACYEVRKISHNLMPEVLLQHGLDVAIRRYCSNISNNDVLVVQYDSWGAIKRFKNSFELSVYRVVQELLNNIVKHSRANKAIVQVSQQHAILSITIEDNGVGFTQKGMKSDGMGLYSLRSRVEAINGTIHLEEPGSGVSAYLEFDTTDLEDQVVNEGKERNAAV